MAVQSGLAESAAAVLKRYWLLCWRLVSFNPSAISRLMVRATNWLGDAVMSVPAIRCLREIFPRAHIAVVARPWVADLYARESAIDRVIVYGAARGLKPRIEFARRLRAEGFEAAILLQNAFDAALMAWLARIPERIGYRRDGRGLLLTRAAPVPESGEIPRHQRFYYLELLRRAGLMERYPANEAIRLEGTEQAREAGVAHLHALGIEGTPVGISPGAAYGNAKRWMPERFAAVARRFQGSPVLIFGAAGERELGAQVAAQIPGAHNLAGQTTLREFIELAAACRLFLTNDSGSMHIASALGVPTVAIFGATDDVTTGPAGPVARVVREHAECSPCLLRECPIDHRCMTAVSAEAVAGAALELWEESAPAWTHEAKS
jgi:heptosyltransferase II